MQCRSRIHSKTICIPLHLGMSLHVEVRAHLVGVPGGDLHRNIRTWPGGARRPFVSRLSNRAAPTSCSRDTLPGGGDIVSKVRSAPPIVLPYSLRPRHHEGSSDHDPRPPPGAESVSLLEEAIADSSSDIAPPKATGSQVLVDVYAAGLNFFDILQAQNKYQSE